jgi:hypothetical protein
MSKNKLYFLLDRSGSMVNIWDETISGINKYIEPIKDADIIVAVFDSYSYDIVRNTTRKNWKDISSNEIQPRGSTPLLDSAARIMHNMMDSGAKNAILVMLTNNYENTSKHFKAIDVKEMTKNLIAKYNYDVVFMGANFDGIADVAKNTFGVFDNSRNINLNHNTMNLGMGIASAVTQNYFQSGLRASEFYESSTKAKLEEASK